MRGVGAQHLKGQECLLRRAPAARPLLSERRWEANLKPNLLEKVVWVACDRIINLDEKSSRLLPLECRGRSAKGQKVKHLMREKAIWTNPCSALPRCLTRHADPQELFLTVSFPPARSGSGGYSSMLSRPTESAFQTCLHRLCAVALPLTYVTEVPR